MNGRILKSTTRFAALVIALSLVPLFQNCGSPSPGFSANSTSSSSSVTVPAPASVSVPPASSYSGNGGGYDGKPYVLADLGRICTDGDGARSRIVENAGVYKLVRLDCTNLATPTTVTVSQMTAAIPGHDSIVYSGHVFDDQSSLVSGTQLPTKGYCSQKNSTAAITVPQPVGTDFTVGLVIAVSSTGSNLVASMIFQDNSSSNDYTTSPVVIGSNPGTLGPLNGRYTYQNGSALLDFNFMNGQAPTVGQQMPVADVATPSITGTLVNYNATLATCTWN